MNKFLAALFFTAGAVCKTVATQPEPIVIDSITVVAGRPLPESGATVVRLDSFALRQNISAGLADALARNTPVYVKSYGRGTLATVSLRGTGTSHTPLLWNGMKIVSPMLGTVDYSLIPSYFIDGADILLGTGSAGIVGGGFGGAISLTTSPRNINGAEFQFIQGVGSFRTFDEFLRFSYGTSKIQLSTRVQYAGSRNDFRYRNYDKEGYPVERNRNASFRDLHVLQEFYWKPNGRDRFDASVWFTGSRRNIPLIAASYRDRDGSVNRQCETALRAVAGWKRNAGKLKLGARAGYMYSLLTYLRLEETGSGELNTITDARNVVHMAFGQFSADYYPVRNLLLGVGAAAYLHSVDSREETTGEGYDKVRPETSLNLTVKWQPLERFTVGAGLRADSYGNSFTPPAFTAFAEWLAWREADMRVRVSGGRNYRYPALNDLYYQPGGNHDLKPESGYSVEAALEAGVSGDRFSFRGSIAAYDSRIDGWILWLYSGNKAGAVWSPVNIRRVHSYGVELSGKMTARMGRDWSLRVDANWAWTPSENRGEPFGANDRSVGKQLPYIPILSTSVMGRLGWRSWAFTYMFNHYSERFTTTSNAHGYSLGEIGPYYMNGISLEKTFSTRRAGISLQFRVNNLFDEEYVSVLSRPMPGINFGFYFGITF